MDIFTTLMTRVVPVPIKPADLKVKALVKKAATNSVSDDIAGLEDPPTLAKSVSKGVGKAKDKHAGDEKTDNKKASTECSTGQLVDVYDDSEDTPDDQDGSDEKHQLDIYI